MATVAKNPVLRPALRTRLRVFSYRYDIPRLLRYLLSTCSIILVITTSTLLPHSFLIRIAPALLFAVIGASSWYGGFGPGALAAFLAVVGTELFTSDSTTALQGRTNDVLLLTVLTAVAYGLSYIKGQRSRGSSRPVLTIAPRRNGHQSAMEGVSGRLLEAFNDLAIAAVDRSWNCIYANQEMAHLIQRNPEDLFGRKIFEIFPDANNAHWFSQLARAAAEPGPSTFEDYVDSLQAWYEFDCHPSSEGLAFRIKNITERKRQEALRPLPLWDDDSEFNQILKTIEYTLVDRARCYMLFQFVKRASELPGDVAEVGVYRGGTAKLMALTLGSRVPKTLHLFDTFEGMPSTDASVDHHRQGDFADTSLEAVQHQLKGCGDVRFYKGFFPDTSGPIESSRFCLVHIDADIYKSVKDSCTFFYPRLEIGGIMVFDDYGFVSCPGARKAVDEFFVDKPESPFYLTSGQCVVMKKHT
jgi:O-methyltransferase